MSDLRPLNRLPLLALGMISLLVGVLAGLSRLGWQVPAFASVLGAWHGPLMVSAFFGTVISLERAVALGKGWAYFGPAASGLAGLALLVAAPLPLAQVLTTLAAAVLSLGSYRILRRQMAAFTATLLVAAVCWLMGALIWLISSNLAAALPWWMAFLVLTIAGERLELTRFLPTPAHARILFLALTIVLLMGAAASLAAEGTGLKIFSAGLLGLSLWLARYDIARRNLRQRGLTRFIALCLLSGYGWLALSGALGVGGAMEPGHGFRDAALHALGLGFVFSMVFGHAPIIFPAVTRARIAYHPVFYFPLLALHLSLALRIAGTLAEHPDWRQTGGLANSLALVVFIATMVAGGLASRRNKK